LTGKHCDSTDVLLAVQLLTASADGTLCIWDVESGALVRSVAAGQPIAGLAVPQGGDTAHLSVAWNDRGAGRARRCASFSLR
jgi:WD40 repeat protein